MFSCLYGTDIQISRPHVCDDDIIFLESPNQLATLSGLGLQFAALLNGDCKDNNIRARGVNVESLVARHTNVMQDFGE